MFFSEKMLFEAKHVIGHFAVVVVGQSQCLHVFCHNSCNKAFCKYTNISITNGTYFWCVCIHCFAVFCFKITCMLIGSAVAKCQIIIRHTDIRNESKYTSKNVDIKLCKSQICWNILKYVQLMIWHLKSALFFRSTYIDWRFYTTDGNKDVCQTRLMFVFSNQNMPLKQTFWYVSVFI